MILITKSLHTISIWLKQKYLEIVQNYLFDRFYAFLVLYKKRQYHKTLKERGIIQSMSRKGNCLDNCVMENFFGKMKNEMFYGHEYEFTSLDQLQKSMEEYINYYNNERIQTKLKGLTPCQARSQALQS